MGLFGYDGDAESSDDLARMEIEAAEQEEVEFWNWMISNWDQIINDTEAENDLYRHD